MMKQKKILPDQVSKSAASFLARVPPFHAAGTANSNYLRGGGLRQFFFFFLLSLFSR